MAEILSYNADIICLQEVDAVIHDTLFRPVLEAKGYQGFYSNKVSQARQRESQARQRESRAREHQQISNDINPSNGASSSDPSSPGRQQQLQRNRSGSSPLSSPSIESSLDVLRESPESESPNVGVATANTASEQENDSM